MNESEWLTRRKRIDTRLRSLNPARPATIPASVDSDAFGRALGPTCGSGGMFVSSARSVAEHKRQPAAGQFAGNRPKDYSGEPTRELSIHGVEKTDEAGRPCRMVAVRKDLAVHGLEGDIRHGNKAGNEEHFRISQTLDKNPALIRDYP
jgi:type I restriction-modification system DNA methylase subunit